MKILVVGDTHGTDDAIIKACNEAGNRKIAHVVVVGDFGLWTHKADGQQFLDAAQALAEVNRLSIYAIGGNHENWDHWNWLVENMPTHKGFAMVRRRVLLAPKAHSWVWDNKQFIGAGGAVSVDRDWRLAQERGGRQRNGSWGMSDYGRGTGSRTLWWPNEQLTDEDVETIRGMHKRADYLFTHDCSNHTPWGHRLKADTDSENHRRRIDEVIRITRAKHHFHGHMHERYEWQNVQSHGYYDVKSACAAAGDITYTHGLNMAGPYSVNRHNTPLDSWGVLDTETDTFLDGAYLTKNNL